MKFFFIIIIFIFTNFSGFADTGRKKEVDPIHKIDSLIHAEHAAGKFNGNVLVAKDGKVVYQKSFGYANSSHEVLTVDHKFLIGSIQKEIPAIAVMQLEEKRMLQLDERLSEYFPGLPKWAEQITLQNLLQYSSGLPKISWGSHKEINNEVLFEDLQKIDELQFSPGKDYLYTNFSPFLLSKVVEKVSGLPFSKYAEENIFLPVGLKNSIFKDQFPYVNPSSMAMGLSSEFIEDYPPFIIREPLFLYATTIEDLYHLIENLHNKKLITTNSLRKIAVPAQKGPINRQSPLGNVVLLEDQIQEHVHHGSSGNYESLMSRHNKEGLTIILMTNRKNGNLFELSSELRKMF